MKFIFVHRHEVSLATSKKLASNCYSVNGYKEVKINEEMKLYNISRLIQNIYLFL